MFRFVRGLVLPLALAAVLTAAGRSAAQVVFVPPPHVCEAVPTTAYYAPPAVAYYCPARCVLLHAAGRVLLRRARGVLLHAAGRVLLRRAGRVLLRRAGRVLLRRAGRVLLRRARGLPGGDGDDALRAFRTPPRQRGRSNRMP